MIANDEKYRSEERAVDIVKFHRILEKHLQFR